MIKEALIRNWATAIVSIAVEQNKVDDYLQVAKDIRLVFKDNFTLTDFLANRDIDFEAKTKVIKTAFEGKIDEKILNAMLLMTSKNLAKATKQIFKQVEHDLLWEKNILKGFIYSVAPLKPTIIKQIEEKFSKKLEKHISLENIIKPELIAGIRVEIEGHKYDSSVQGKAMDLKRKILTNRK